MSAPELWAKRRGIELGQIRVPSAVRRALVHPGNLRVARGVLRGALRLLGLWQRGQRNALDLVVTHRRFAFPALPPTFSGFRILHLSDLHADVPDGLAQVVADRLGPLDADLCVLTGDYRFEVRGAAHRAHAATATILQAVRARHGIVGILGNHDSGESVEVLRGLGVHVLVNASLMLKVGDDRLSILGVDDPHYYRCADLEAALRDVPEGGFTILLAHSPELFGAASAAGVDLYLCGHTHAGQIAFPLLGPLWLNAACPRAFASGPWAYGKMQGFTSAGVGTSLLPVRFNCQPEIALIELRGGTEVARGEAATEPRDGVTRT